MAHETSFREIELSTDQIGVRKIRMADLWQSLREGYRDFNDKPTFGVFLAVIYPLFALLLTWFMTGENILYLAFPVVAGMTLLGPIVSTGLFEMSRLREEGEEVSWRAAFEFVHTSAFAPIAAMSFLMMLLYVAWLFMAQFIYSGIFGGEPPATMSELWGLLFTTRQGGALVMYGLGVGFFFAFAAFAMSVVGFPLALDKPVTSITAMETSIRAVSSNLGVMAVWALGVVLLLAAGAVLFLIGLAIVLPILGHATWHLYRKMVHT